MHILSIDGKSKYDGSRVIWVDFFISQFIQPILTQMPEIMKSVNMDLSHNLDNWPQNCRLIISLGKSWLIIASTWMQGMSILSVSHTTSQLYSKDLFPLTLNSWNLGDSPWKTSSHIRVLSRCLRNGGTTRVSPKAPLNVLAPQTFLKACE